MLALALAVMADAASSSCKLCGIALSSNAVCPASNAPRPHCCGRWDSAQKHAWWPFYPLASVAEDHGHCRLCGQDAGAHRGLHTLFGGGLYCAVQDAKLCCDCGKRQGVPFFFTESCAFCAERKSKTLLEGNSPDARHLIVLCHGLYGLPSELFAARDKLQALRGCLVHCCESYSGSGTKRGINDIGELIAAEVRSIVEACAADSSRPALSTISFIGHSMGGVVARSAISKLFDPADSTIAGLQPLVYVSTASPHLGITNYGPLPQLPVGLTAPLASIFAGKSGRDLFSIETEDGVIRTLATDETALRALASFPARRMYALKAGDMLVDFARSAFQTPATFLQRHHRTYVAEASAAAHTLPPGAAAEAGTCRVTFRESLPGHLRFRV